MIPNGFEPRIVIGMPVYNGERHLQETVESILAQTFKDFILLISDNASTDRTGEICQKFAEEDNRIKYYRQPKNIGMAGNFNFVFQPGNAPFFKWAAHDDLIEPEYLEQCIKTLQEDASLAIAHSPSRRIDDNGNFIEIYKDLGLSSESISERFWRVLWTDNIYEIYGVMRSEFAAKANPVGSFFGAERNLLAEILLQGDITYINKPLFTRRDHEFSLTAMHLQAKQNKDFSSMQSAHAPKARMNKLAASTIKYWAYFSAIKRFPMPLSDRLACIYSLVDWSIRRGVDSLTGLGHDYRWNLIDKYQSLTLKEFH